VGLFSYLSQIVCVLATATLMIDASQS